MGRRWQLLHLIDRPGGITVDGAAKELGCTIRSVWRGLDVLQRAGFPRSTTRRAPTAIVWHVQEDFQSRLPLKLTLAEIAVLLMSRDVLSPLGPTDWE